MTFTEGSDFSRVTAAGRGGFKTGAGIAFLGLSAGFGRVLAVLIAGIFLLFALTLTGRTYVKATEPGMLAKKRHASSLRAVAEAKQENAASVAEAKANNGFQAEEIARS